MDLPDAEFGSWMLATHRRNRGCGRGGAGASSHLGAHVTNNRHDVSNSTVDSLQDDANLAVGPYL